MRCEFMKQMIIIFASVDAILRLMSFTKICMYTHFNRFCFYLAVPVRNGSSVPGCRKTTCQCYLYDCWYGENPCICNKYHRKCPVNEYFVYEGGRPGKKLFSFYKSLCMDFKKSVELRTYIYIYLFVFTFCDYFKILLNKK